MVAPPCRRLRLSLCITPEQSRKVVHCCKRRLVKVRDKCNAMGFRSGHRRPSLDERPPKISFQQFLSPMTHGSAGCTRHQTKTSYYVFSPILLYCMEGRCLCALKRSHVGQEQADNSRSLSTTMISMRARESAAVICGHSPTARLVHPVEQYFVLVRQT